MIVTTIGKAGAGQRMGLKDFYKKKSKEELIDICVDLYIDRQNIIREYNALYEYYQLLVKEQEQCQ